jgi:hypothetical protein
VKVVTALFGYIGKASAGRAVTPEEGDTKVLVPGVLQPSLEIPYPIFSLFNTPLPAGQLPVNSFIYAEELLFNVGTGVGLFVIGPGLWDIETSLIQREAGAVSDPTSTYRLELVDTLTAATVVIHRISNIQGRTQTYQSRWRQLVTVDSAYQFTRTTIAGLGTGTNFGHLKIICTRLF